MMMMIIIIIILIMMIITIMIMMIMIINNRNSYLSDDDAVSQTGGDGLGNVVGRGLEGCALLHAAVRKCHTDGLTLSGLNRCLQTEREQ